MSKALIITGGSGGLGHCTALAAAKVGSLRQLMVALAVTALTLASPWPLEAQQRSLNLSVLGSNLSSDISDLQTEGSRTSKLLDNNLSPDLFDTRLDEFKYKSGFILAAAEPQKQAPPAARAQGQKGPASSPQTHPGGDLGEVGAKLANPLGALWALSFSLNAPQFFDGDVNTGDPEVGGSLLFQPIMPIPVYGTGDDEWKIITRPVIPFIFSQPIPTGLNEFTHKGGIGDIQLPFLLNPSQRITGNSIIGGGPVFQFPSATSNDLGKNQWAMGPAVVLGYKTKAMTAGIFPNYFWKIGSAGQRANTPDISQGSLLYFLAFNLPDAWQIGMNPTMTYNNRASSGNKWNVPIGLYVGKTIRIGKVPLNIKVGSEYSVVSPDEFGQRFQFIIQFTPVIPSLIQNPIFGK